MMYAMTLVVIVAVEPGPLDAFRANGAATRVRLGIEHTAGSLPQDEFSEERVWKGELGFIKDDRLTITGRWACDGTAEYYLSSKQGQEDQSRRPGSAGGGTGINAYREQLLFDGEMTIRRDEQSNRVVVMLTDEPSLPQGIGPYLWDIVNPFPLILKKQFPEHRPKRFTATRNGHPTEAEIYYRDQSDGWHQLEVYYDIDSGYVPRFVRLVKYSKSQDLGYVRSTYIVSMRSCVAGGFVPTEWFSVFHMVPGFVKKYPDYTTETEIKPRGSISIDRFRVTDFADLDGPVRLEDDKGVAILSSFGGQVSAKGLANRMTIANVRGALGGKLRIKAGPVMPHLDAGELAGMTHPTRMRWMPYAIAIAITTALAMLFGWRLRRRWSATSILLAMPLIGSWGCGVASKPVVHVTGSFVETQVIHEPNAMIPLELILKNDGNQAVRITQVDGGCSCRRVDQSPLPTTIKPGKALKLGLTMVGGKQFEPLNVMFTLDTDQGRLTVPSLIYTMPSQHVSPESPTNDSLVGEQAWDFELVHRAVFRRADSRPASPPGPASPDGTFRIVKQSARGGVVNGAPGFGFEDTQYKVTLLDRSFGLRKAVIDVGKPDGPGRLEVPVTWRRSPFLSSVPDRVVFGSRPVRTFLRCPDQGVELTAVLDAPEGVKAAISGPREVTLTLSEDAPGIIRGDVRVKTTASGSGLNLLVIPVVRYKPVVMR